MGTIVKAGAIIIGGTAALYLVLFLVVMPMMAKGPAMAQAMGANIYAALYIPLRDALPAPNAIRTMMQDYEHYWCVGSSQCEL